MAVLDDIKILKRITDNNRDGELSIYICRAETLIRNYLNANSAADISEMYPDAVICYVMECLNKKGNENLKQFTQGSRSGTYESGLSSDVKNLLPVPSARMLG